MCVYAEQGSLSPGSHAIVYDMLVIFAPSFVDSDEKANCQMNLLTKHGINQCCKGMSHSVNRQNDLVQGEDKTRLGAFPFHTSCSYGILVSHGSRYTAFNQGTWIFLFQTVTNSVVNQVCQLQITTKHYLICNVSRITQ